MMQEFHWSAAEKKAARAAFDLALSREMDSVRREVESILAHSPEALQVWRVHDYLSEKRLAIDQKYDYRYSVLLTIFSRLVHEGWLTEGDLSGLEPEKLQVVRRITSFQR